MTEQEHIAKATWLRRLHGDARAVDYLLENGWDDHGVLAFLNLPWVVGTKYFIRSVTMHYVGECAAVYPDSVVMRGCSWVADDGRFHEAIQNGTLAEVEPYGEREVGVSRGAISDWVVWDHDLPTEAQ